MRFENFVEMKQSHPQTYFIIIKVRIGYSDISWNLYI